MEIKNPVTIVPPELWTKIFELLTTLKPDYSKNLYTNDILNCYHVCVTFRNILRPTIISSLFPQILPFIHPYITNKSIKPILNFRLVCKAWKQGVDHFLETHDIFTRKQLQDRKVLTNYLITSSPNRSFPMTCLFTKQDITTFCREKNERNGSPFLGNSLLIRYNPLGNQTGTNCISISSVQELLIKFGQYIKVLYLHIFQYQYLHELEQNYPYKRFYDQIRNILEYLHNLRKLSIKGYLNIYTHENIEIQNLNDIVDREFETLKLPYLESMEIDIGGRHCFGLKLAINLGLCSSSFLQLKRLSLSNNLLINFNPQSKTDQEKWLHACRCLPNMEQLEVRILAVSNLLEVFHLVSKSTKLNSLTIKVATHSWKDHVKYFSKYYPYDVEPFYGELCSNEYKRECLNFRNSRLDLGSLLRTVQALFCKSLETLVIFVEEVARKYCKANKHDLEILKEMSHLRNLHIEGFPMYKVKILGNLPFTLRSLMVSGVFHSFYFEYDANELERMPGVSNDLEDGWKIYQSEIWEQLPGLQLISVVAWDYNKEQHAVYIHRREKRDWLLTRNKKQVDQEKYLVNKPTSTENKICCSVV